MKERRKKVPCKKLRQEGAIVNKANQEKARKAGKTVLFLLPLPFLLLPYRWLREAAVLVSIRPVALAT